MPVVRRGTGGLAGLALLSACAAVQLPPPLDSAARTAGGMGETEFPAQVRIEQPGMTCRSATAAARTAIRKLGFETQSVLSPAPGETGEIRAVRHTGWKSGYAGSAHAAAVRISCDDRGAAIVAATEEPFRDRLNFKRDFPTQFDRAIVRRGGLPTDQARRPPADLRVAIEPISGRTAAQQIGGTPEVIGLTPVRIAISNHTDTRYRFDTQSIQFVSQEGVQVQPLPFAEVAGRLTPEWSERARTDQLRSAEIPPGTDVTGYIYVPAAAYRRAVLLLIEVESEEAEGFAVEF